MRMILIFVRKSPLPALALLIAACGQGTEATDGGVISTLVHASDVPLDGLSHDDVKAFNSGDQKFDTPFRDVDGLGPLYIRTSCGACHEDGSRGPGLVQKMVVMEADGVTPAADQSSLTWGHTVRKGLAAGATTAIVPPTGPNVLVTTRQGPPVLGRGYLEAIADSEIERVAAEQAQRTDAIHGAVSRVTFTSVPNPDTTFGAFTQGQTNLIGRFGLKAREVTLDDFTADAFQGDMGLTTPMRPAELPNPDGLTDDSRAGVDLDQEHIDSIAFYLRRIAIPPRVNLDQRGSTLFDQAQCAACHVRTLKTRADYPIAPLANIDAPVFCDLLLHDMGDALADGMTDGSASSKQWRTAPLIGLRFAKVFLHDGRAVSVREAIEAHQGEATASASAFSALSEADQAALVRFVEAL
ncbi:MAG: di-heme oxidoredictase family protein [Myxococcaceae bacterium]